MHTPRAQSSRALRSVEQGGRKKTNTGAHLCEDPRAVRSLETESGLVAAQSWMVGCLGHQCSVGTFSVWEDAEFGEWMAAMPA